MTALNYQLIPQSAHRFLIRLRLTHGSKLQAYLPIWIPGSYTRRDFSRFLNLLRIENNGKALNWQLQTPSAWQAEGEAGEWLIEYEIYARDYSVRGCYLDDARAMFNPAAACLAIREREQDNHRLQFLPDASRAAWQSAGAIPSGENEWQFPDYQTLIDSPLMLAAHLARSTFQAGGISHEITICGHHQALPLDILTQDVAAICQSAIAQFGRLPDNVPHYSFMLFLTENGYGGLEHQSSTLLMASREAANGNNRSAYEQLLGLFAHEYFHTWNVKSLRPKTYAQGYELEREQPSEMLWLFEGFTAYFDNLLLLRSGIITPENYLKLLSQDISRYLQRQGQQHQSLVHSSFEAWTKLYNGGENAANISTNYYIHGALAAWCLDAYLHQHSLDNAGLDKRLAEIWQQAAYREQGIDEKDFIREVQAQLAAERQSEFADFLHRLIHRCDFLPLDFAAQTFGLSLQYLAPLSINDTGTSANPNQRASSEAGFRWQEQQGKFLIRLNDPNSAAAQAGIAAGDEIIAVCGEKVSAATLWQQLMCGQSGRNVSIHVLRDGLLRQYQWPLAPALKNTAWLSIHSKAEMLALKRREKWWQQ